LGLWLTPTLITAQPALVAPTSGVYEVVTGTDERGLDAVKQHFALFGFRQIASGALTEDAAHALYGVRSALRSIRMQNGSVDSHGLLRIMVWQQPLGPGVGYAPPETVGQRLSVLMVDDIMRIDDVFQDARLVGQSWLPITPVFADLFGQTQGKPDLHNRRVGVRESGVYGELFNHVFFQRYGYTIKGYGTLNTSAPLPASEFTHHDFIISGDINAKTQYVVDVLGFKEERPASLDGDWLEGPKKVFGMVDGGSHWYRGFVAPNNICGKLKFFAPRDVRTDRQQHQRLGELGITMHTVYSEDVAAVRARADRAGLQPSPLRANEFAETGFVFVGPDGSSWQVLGKGKISHSPVTELKLERIP